MARLCRTRAAGALSDAITRAADNDDLLTFCPAPIPQIDA